MSEGGSLRASILAQISDRLSVPADQVDDEALLTDLGFDSLDAVEVAMLLEEEHGIEIDDAAIESVKTFGDLVGLVERKLAGKAASA
jgi:acyl carrier protein